VKKNSFTFTILIVSFSVLTSCDLNGVSSIDEQIDDNIIANDKSVNDNYASITDSLNDQLSTTLLTDSVSGQPNNMVYQSENGLRIEWTEKSTEDPILLNDVVMVNYKARVAGGEQYDSNEELGVPIPLKTNIGMMIEGWETGLLKMNIGDKGRIMIPNKQAYGENGYSTIVPPKADLIIDIEIVERIIPVELKEGVKVYKWKINEGGKTPKKDDHIVFDYFAYTMGKDGHLYDNSFKDSQPFSFVFENDNVVDGLHQGMSKIKSGENAFIEIPAKLAYGKTGLQDLVPKNTSIVYDVRISNID